MKRLLILAFLGLMAQRADAQMFKILSGDPNKKWWAKNGYEPPPLGPWYNYWPLEAHFQVPAMPEYPYWSAPQTMPVVPPAPYNAKPLNGAGLFPQQGHPNWNAPSNQPPAQMQPANAAGNLQPNAAHPALSGHPGLQAPYAGYGYPRFPQQPPYAPGMGYPQR